MSVPDAASRRRPTCDSHSSNEQQPTRRRRILVVEDHPIVRQGLVQVIQFEKDLEVCGIAEDCQSALRQIGLCKPDLILLDISLKECNGLDLLQTIKATDPGQHVLVLSMHEEDIYGPRAIRLGASGYIMKQEPTTVLLAAIRKTLAGDHYVSGRMEKKLWRQCLRGRSGSALDPVERLSPRELQIFKLLGQGIGTSEIARQLSLSVKTVESHRGRIKTKLDLTSSTELIRHAMEMERTFGGQPDVPE